MFVTAHPTDVADLYATGTDLAARREHDTQADHEAREMAEWRRWVATLAHRDPASLTDVERDQLRIAGFAA